MELAVMGPVEVVGGTGVELHGVMVRRLAAALAVNPGGSPSDTLIDALWGDDAPPSARKTLQGFVHRLRRTLGPTALLTTPDGYRLDTELVQVDTAVFDRELAQAEALRADGRADAGLALVEAALRRRRGVPFADLGEWPGALAERARLEECYRSAEELRAELWLELRRADLLVGDLEALAASAPLRERRWGLLIEAMRRAGRPAEALRAFERARSTLIDALGAEPGPALQAAYRQLLVETASPVSCDASPSTLPTPRSSFVGREPDLAMLLDTLASQRLVTLVGTGGSGKTRLAIELGHRWQQRHGEAVWFADLTGVADPWGLFGALDAGLGHRPVGAAHGPGVAALLAAERGLLIVDNAEHLLGAVAELVDDVLDAAPGVRLLVTSRESLGVEGECRWPLGPLSGGPAGDAVSLFVARARACCPGFAGDAEHLADVVALCGDLDRLPLALELAAAHVGVLSPAELRRQLAVQGDLPRPVGDSPPRRHRPGGARWSSLGAALRWSTDSLSPQERAAFLRLSVLPDHFGLDAAEKVCDLADGDALHVLESLVHKSLLGSTPTSGTARFRMLDTVRRHAAAGLADVPASCADALDGLLAWAVGQAESYQQLAADQGHRAAMDLADREQHNLRAALDRAADGGSTAQGIGVICLTEDWWRASGHTTEAWERLRGLLDRVDDDIPEETWLQGVTRLAVFAAFDEEARRVSADLVRRAEQRLDGVQDAELRLRLAVDLAWVQLDLTDAMGEDRLLDLLAESRRLGGLMGSSLLHYLTIWQLSHGDAAGALASAAACEVAARSNGSDVSLAHNAELYGMVLTTNRRHDEARDWLRKALDGLVSVDHLGCVLHCMEAIAWWAASAARTDEARSLLGLADALRTSLRRTRFSVERYAYDAAVGRCGEPIPPTTDDLLGEAMRLADDLLSNADGPARRPSADTPGVASPTQDRRLSRPAWL